MIMMTSINKTGDDDMEEHPTQTRNKAEMLSLI
jgi:hypothetical protein